MQTKSNETPVVKPTRIPKPRKPRAAKQSALTLGAKQTVRIASKRAIKSTINKTQLNPAIKLGLIAGIGGLLSYFLNKK